MRKNIDGQVYDFSPEIVTCEEYIKLRRAVEEEEDWIPVPPPAAIARTATLKPIFKIGLRRVCQFADLDVFQTVTASFVTAFTMN